MVSLPLLLALYVRLSEAMYNKLKFFLVAFVIIFLSLNASASTFRIFMQDIVIPEECVLKLNAHFAKE